MNGARSICTMKASVLIIVILSCVGLSLVGTFLTVLPRVEHILVTAAGKYDALFPEIIIRNGHASIRERQPHFLDYFDQNHLIIAIDTREGLQNEALEYLKGARSGAVLTAMSIVIKNEGETRIISLDGIPDMVINSQNIQSALEEFWPSVTRWGMILMAAYFMIVKSLQAIILAWIPYVVGRFCSVFLTYAEALKIAVVGMIIPVSLDFLYNFFGTSVSISIFLYFVSYVIVLVFAVMALGRDRAVQGQQTAINPS